MSVLSHRCILFHLIEPLRSLSVAQSSHSRRRVLQFTSTSRALQFRLQGNRASEHPPRFRCIMESIKETQKDCGEFSVDFGYTIAYPFALRAAVLLNVPKIIHSAGPGAALSAADICTHLANPEHASSGNLEKILEVLSCYGMLTLSTVQETPTKRVRKYGLTSLSQHLTRDASARFLLFCTAPELIQVWPNMHQTVLNPDEVVFEKVYGKGVYRYLNDDVPELGKFHVKVMESLSANQLESLLEHYDEEFKNLTGTLVDVGGSQGAVAAVIVSKYPNIERVINFDLPNIVSGAPPIRGVEHVGGSFLDFVPQGDLLFLKAVLLNCDDDNMVKFLRNCFNALPAKGKAIIVDNLKPDSDPEEVTARLRTATQGLLTSLTFKGGKSRTVQQLRSAAEAAGFAKLHVVKMSDVLGCFEVEKA